MSAARKRISNEYNNLKINPLPYLFVSLNKNDMLSWHAVIIPAEPYQDLVFSFDIDFTDSRYPFYFPRLRFPPEFCTCFLSNKKSSWSPTQKMRDIFGIIYNTFKEA